MSLYPASVAGNEIGLVLIWPLALVPPAFVEVELELELDPKASAPMPTPTARPTTTATAANRASLDMCHQLALFYQESDHPMRSHRRRSRRLGRIAAVGDGRSILITGCSSPQGIGFAAARSLARAGHSVHATVRNHAHDAEMIEGLDEPI